MLLNAVCAQDYISRHDENYAIKKYIDEAMKAQLAQVSIDFNVLCRYTAMFGKIRLTDEQKEAIASGEIDEQTIHANAAIQDPFADFQIYVKTLTGKTIVLDVSG